jgi:hypothetical protein
LIAKAEQRSLHPSAPASTISTGSGTISIDGNNGIENGTGMDLRQGNLASLTYMASDDTAHVINCTNALCTTYHDIVVDSAAGNYPMSGASTVVVGPDNLPRIVYSSENAAGVYFVRFATLDGLNASAGSSVGTSNSPFGSINTKSLILNGTNIANALWTTSSFGIYYNGGNVGIGTMTPASRLSLVGPDTSGSTAAFTITNSASTNELQVFDDGHTVLAGTLTQNSDQRLKTNIQSLDASSSLAAIDALNPVTFNWIDQSQGSSTQIGFIAQQVQQLFPGLVSTTSPTKLTPDGTLGVNYIGFIAPIISAIQALSAEVQSLITTVQGFAQSITSVVGTFNQLCVNDTSGKTCISRAQLDAILAGTGQSPSNPVQISAGSFTIASSIPSSNEGTTTSTTTDTVIIVAASSTPPTSPPTDATTSAATSTSQ